MKKNFCDDSLYMRRCLQLAAMAEGHTSPNPMVGAVVVCDGRVIGEGYHRCCGEAHAEVNAIASVRDKSLLSHSTLYVSLEPCSHFGKTPPCCDLIISCGIPKVVVGCLDPFPQVAGRGVARLREHGVEVTVGVLADECRRLNRAFMTFQLKARPYILLKWAQSADGFMDYNRRAEEPPARLSDDITRVWVHRLRAVSDAILVGTNTVMKDNPLLTVRYWGGRNPLRVTIDRHGRIPLDAHILDGSVPTLLLGNPVGRAGIEAVSVPDASDVLTVLMDELSRRKIQSLMVEGGSSLLQSFIAAGLWDEARIETSPFLLHEGVPSPTITGREMQINVHGDGRYVRILSHR